MQANYLSSTGVLQRGPTGPVQNSVVPGLQPSSSYYSGSAGIFILNYFIYYLQIHISYYFFLKIRNLQYKLQIRLNA